MKGRKRSALRSSANKRRLVSSTKDRRQSASRSNTNSKRKLVSNMKDSRG